jgi:signal transduction histidine kinase
VRVRKVLNSLTFRYIAKYLAALIVSVFLLHAALFSYFSHNYFNSLGESIVDEIQTLQLVHAGQSFEGVSTYLEDQYREPSGSRFSYLLLNKDGEKLTGDLEVSHSYEEFPDGWLGFDHTILRWGESVDVDYLARRAKLGDAYEVIVARDYAHALEQFQLVFRTLVRVMVATLILGLIGGFFTASSALKRVETLSQELSKISRGDPRARLDLMSESGYVRELYVLVNAILDQMESLMLGVQRVSDNIAHDLRTPLTRIRNQLSELGEGLAPESAQSVESIIAECDELLRTFNALLRISTLETGKRSTASVELDLGGLLQDVIELYEPLIQQKNIALTFRADSQLCRGEADLLFQMFANLVDNAVKYTPENGSIELVLGSSPEGVHTVSICDSGPGIAVADRKNVFRRFFRVESSRGEQPGHGLGLSLAQAIAQYHNGGIKLSPNNPGLRVTVELP